MLLPALLRPAAVLLALLPAWAAASSIGLLTIVDGDAALLRETQRFVAAEGQRLRNDDIVRTDAKARLLRIELADGTLLDLGPDTELLLQPRAAGALGERAATLYLARGWLKLTSPSGGTAGVAAAAFDLPRVAGTAVVRCSTDTTLVFVESGAGALLERSEARTDSDHALKEGDTYLRRGAAAGSVQRRLPADLLQGLPRAFVDSLPRRAARFQATPVEPAGGVEPAYAELAPWLNGEAALRAHLLPRFTPLARDHAFRAGLIADLRIHPEWERVLFPEKTRAKPVVVVRRPVPIAAAEPAPALPVAARPVPALAPAPSLAPLRGIGSASPAAADATLALTMETP